MCPFVLVGVKYDTINKDLGSSTEREGLHSGPPGYEFIVFPSVFRSLEFSLKVGTVRRFFFQRFICSSSFCESREIDVTLVTLKTF